MRLADKIFLFLFAQFSAQTPHSDTREDQENQKQPEGCRGVKHTHEATSRVPSIKQQRQNLIAYLFHTVP